MKKATFIGQAYSELADDIANEEIAKNEIAERSKLAETQQEREEFIAEAYRITGRIEGINILTKFGNISNLIFLNQVKKSKIYRDMPGIRTWEKYCECVGYTERHIDEQLKNLEKLGDKFLETISDFGISQKDIRKLRSATSDGTLAINDQSITIEITEGEEKKSETIPFNDKEALKDKLEELIADRDEKIAAKDRELEGQKKLVETKNRYIERADADLINLEKRLKEYEGGEINGMPADDFPAFNRMQTIASDLTAIHTNLNNLMNENLSQANTLYLYGTIMHMTQLASELSSLVPTYGTYGELPMDEEEIVKTAAKLPIPGLRNMEGHKSAPRPSETTPSPQRGEGSRERGTKLAKKKGAAAQDLQLYK